MNGAEHVYNDENELISKNTTVTVQRAPLENGQKKVWEEDVMLGPELTGSSGASCVYTSKSS